MANRRSLMFVSTLLLLVSFVLTPVSMIFAQSNCESDCPCPICISNTYTVNVVLKINGMEPMDIYDVSVVTTSDYPYPVYMNFAGTGMKVLNMDEGVKGLSINFDHELYYLRGIYTKNGDIWEFPMSPMNPCDGYTFIIELVSIHVDGKPFPEEPQPATPTDPESPSLSAGDSISNSIVFDNSNEITQSVFTSGNNSPAWVNYGSYEEDNSQHITQEVEINFVYIFVEEDKPKRPDLKLSEHLAPLAPPMAPKPVEPRVRDDSDQHSRHQPIIDTHPGKSPQHREGSKDFDPNIIVQFLRGALSWVLNNPDWVIVAILLFIALGVLSSIGLIVGALFSTIANQAAQTQAGVAYAYQSAFHTLLQKLPLK